MLVFSFEAEEASGRDCGRGLGAIGTQADTGGLRRGQQGEDNDDRMRELAREAAGFGSGGRRLVGSLMQHKRGRETVRETNRKRRWGEARRSSTPLDRRGRRRLSIEAAGFSGGFESKSSGSSSGWWEEEWEDPDVDSVECGGG